MANRNDTPKRRRRRTKGAPWSPKVIRAALEDAGFTLQQLGQRWGSYPRARKIIGLAPSAFGSEYREERQDIADILGVPLRDLLPAWAEPANDGEGTDNGGEEAA
jgi:lambda repressor-like predicted transcriptional regulator